MGNNSSAASPKRPVLVEEIEKTVKVHHRTLPPLGLASEELITAVRSGDERTTFELLHRELADTCAHIGESDKRGSTGEGVWIRGNYPLLFFAIQRHDEPMVRLLCGAGGGCPEALSRYYLVQCAATDRVRESDAGIIQAETPNDRQFVTMTDLSAVVGNKLLMERLLKAGAVVSQSTLAYAAYCGHAPILLALKDSYQASDIMSQGGYDTVYAPSAWPASPLAIAAGRGHVAATNVLLRLGADPNFSLARRDGIDRPLHQAVLGPVKWYKRADEEDGIRAFTRGGPTCVFVRANVLVGTTFHRAPLPTATAYRKVIRALIAAGADATARGLEATEAASSYTEGGLFTALELACFYQVYPAIVEILLNLPEGVPFLEPQRPYEILQQSVAEGRKVYLYAQEDVDEELRELDEEARLLRQRKVSFMIPAHKQLYERALFEMKEQMRSPPVA